MTIISNKVINISVGIDIFSRKTIVHVMTIIIITMMMKMNIFFVISSLYVRSDFKLIN